MTYTPPPDFQSIDTFTYTVTDSGRPRAVRDGHRHGHRRHRRVPGWRGGVRRRVRLQRGRRAGGPALVRHPGAPGAGAAAPAEERRAPGRVTRSSAAPATAGARPAVQNGRGARGRTAPRPRGGRSRGSGSTTLVRRSTWGPLSTASTRRLRRTVTLQDAGAEEFPDWSVTRVMDGVDAAVLQRVVTLLSQPDRAALPAITMSFLVQPSLAAGGVLHLIRGDVGDDARGRPRPTGRGTRRLRPWRNRRA